MQVNQEQFRMQQELNRLRLQQRYLLETLKSSVLVLDADNVITSGNDATHAIWGIPASRLIGRSLENSELGRLCPELGGKLARPAGEGQAGGTGATGHQTFELQCRVQVAGEERVLSLTVRPITGDDGAWHGSLVYSEDMTHRRRLQQTVAQLENTSSELQSANEELETTNEELQSTNEELETTNKELQSTNEELETTNEELQSVNEELENMNEELEARTRELNALSSRYAETWQRMPWPVLLVDRNEKIQVSNAAAQALLELQQSAAAGLRFDLLPIEAGSRRSLLVSLRRVIDSREPGVLRHYALPGDEAEEQVFDVHLTPILESGKEVEGVLIMFGPQQLGTAGRRKSSQPTEAKDQL